MGVGLYWKNAIGLDAGAATTAEKGMLNLLDESSAVYRSSANAFSENVVASKGFRVDSSMFAADEAAGVLRNGSYIKNPAAQRLSDLVTDSGRIGSKNMNGQYMYVVDQEGSIIIGTRSGQRMPHPTLVGGENPQVLGAGIVDIRGGKVYSVDNASGHFKPGAGSLEAARDAFSKLPSNVFHKNFQGYIPYKAGGG